MSNPSSITVSLEMAEKLKEAGWLQAETHFLWTWVRGTMVVISGPDFIDPKYTRTDKTFDAPTAEEILRRLPITVGAARLSIDRMPMGEWWVGYSAFNDAAEEPTKQDKESLANAAAAMYCYLAENKLLPAA